jgi:hypothetical protein
VVSAATGIRTGTTITTAIMATTATGRTTAGTAATAATAATAVNPEGQGNEARPRFPFPGQPRSGWTFQ